MITVQRDEEWKVVCYEMRREKGADAGNGPIIGYTIGLYGTSVGAVFTAGGKTVREAADNLQAKIDELKPKVLDALPVFMEAYCPEVMR